ncbi:MAG: hypothetical protein KC417_03180, partial [Myxococcales bacterium]|nr:hypothetical protein [Myxococcales bacterium]
YTTHYMEEAERLSDDLLVLSEGKAIASGAPKDILGRMLGDHVVVVRGDAPERARVEAWAGEQGHRTTRVLGELRMPVSREGLAAFTASFETLPFSVRDPNLDDLFLVLARGAHAAPASETKRLEATS